MRVCDFTFRLPKPWAKGSGTWKSNSGQMSATDVHPHYIHGMCTYLSACAELQRYVYPHLPVYPSSIHHPSIHVFIHLPIYLSVYLSKLSIYDIYIYTISRYLSVYVYICIHIYIHLICIYTSHISASASICLPACLAGCLSVCPSVCQSLNLCNSLTTTIQQNRFQNPFPTTY